MSGAAPSDRAPSGAPAKLTHRVAAALLLLFCAGHTVGAFLGRSPAPEADVVLEAMRTVRFDFHGVNRSFYELFLGHAHLVSLYLAVSRDRRVDALEPRGRALVLGRSDRVGPRRRAGPDRGRGMGPLLSRPGHHHQPCGASARGGQRTHGAAGQAVPRVIAAAQGAAARIIAPSGAEEAMPLHAAALAAVGLHLTRRAFQLAAAAAGATRSAARPGGTAQSTRAPAPGRASRARGRRARASRTRRGGARAPGARRGRGTRAPGAGRRGGARGRRARTVGRRGAGLLAGATAAKEPRRKERVSSPPEKKVVRMVRCRSWRPSYATCRGTGQPRALHVGVSAGAGSPSACARGASPPVLWARRARHAAVNRSRHVAIIVDGFWTSPAVIRLLLGSGPIARAP